MGSFENKPLDGHSSGLPLTEKAVQGPMAYLTSRDSRVSKPRGTYLLISSQPRALGHHWTLASLARAVRSEHVKHPIRKAPKRRLTTSLALPTPSVIDKPLLTQAALQSAPVVPFRAEREVNLRALVSLRNQVRSDALVMRRLRALLLVTGNRCHAGDVLWSKQIAVASGDCRTKEEEQEITLVHVHV